MIVTRNAALVLGVLVPLAANTLEAQSCSCEVSDRKEAAYDWLLALDAQESEATEAWHMPFCPDYVEPVFDRGHMAPNADFVRGYDQLSSASPAADAKQRCDPDQRDRLDRSDRSLDGDRLLDRDRGAGWESGAGNRGV